MALPKVLKNYNLFVDGTSMLGLCTQVSLPELSLVTESYRGGGMDGMATLDLGMEDIELGFTLSENREEVFRQFGLVNQNAVAVQFRAALVDDTVVDPYIIDARGIYTTLTLGDVELGQVNPLEAAIMCRYFKLALRGTDLIEIDIDNMIRRINGVDQLEAQRNVLSR